MATQQQAIDFMKSNYKAEVLGDGTLFKLIFDIDDGRTQIVYAQFNEHFICFSSPFASTEDMTPKQALSAAEDWLCGVRVIGDFYYLRNVAPLENLDESELADNMMLVAFAADKIEEKYIGVDTL